MNEPGPRPTFDELCQIEPRLKQLALDAEARRRKNKYSVSVTLWFQLFRPRLGALAGFGARNPALRTQKAYDAAYDAIYQMLLPGAARPNGKTRSPGKEDR